MKRTALVFTTVFALLCASAISMAQSVVVYLKNGEQVVYTNDELDYIQYAPKEAPEEPFNILTPECIPDTVFFRYVKTQLADGKDTYTNVQAAAYTGGINLDAFFKIESLQGLEYFKNVTSIYASGCTKLEPATLPPLEHLVSLKVGQVRLDPNTFDFFGLYPNLQFLGISSIKVNGPLKITSETLTGLHCDNMGLTSLDVSGCPNLVELVASYNGLEMLDITGLTKIEEFYIHQNPYLGAIDMTPFQENLRELNISRTGLEKFDVTKCPNLTMLEMQDNYFFGKTIDFTVCPKLQHLRCENSQLKGVKVAGLKDLAEFACYQNNLTELDLSGCESLYLLNAFTNKISEVNLEGCTSLVYCFLSTNELSEIDLTPIKDVVQQIDLWQNDLSDIQGLNLCTNLTKLDASENSITSLRVENLQNLGSLDLSDNPLENIEIVNCPNIFTLFLVNDLLSRVDLTGIAMESLTSGSFCTYGNPGGVEIKVWPEFDRNNPPEFWFIDEDDYYVYQFTD